MKKVKNGISFLIFQNPGTLITSYFYSTPIKDIKFTNIVYGKYERGDKIFYLTC